MALEEKHWFDTGLSLLVAEGPHALTVEALCRRLSVTKGSFYHHFQGYDSFRSGLLAYVEREGTLEIIERAEEASTPRDKLRRLLDVIVALLRQSEWDPEVAIRAWALQDTDARALQERVDRRRIAYVQGLWEQMGSDAPQAEARARLLYAILVGSQQMMPPANADELQALFDAYRRLYQLDRIESEEDR